MTTWEYRVLDVRSTWALDRDVQQGTIVTADERRERFEEELNVLGSTGWELVACPDGRRCLLKRPLAARNGA